MTVARERATDEHLVVFRHDRIADRVVDLLKEKILREEMRPGDRVVEQTVAREFGVGQNPVREALIELAHMGFVRRIPRRGTYITNLTRAEAKKIVQVKYVLEDLALKLICERFKDKNIDLRAAQKTLDLMREAARQENVLGFYENDMQFHRILWVLADNEYLAKALEQVVAPLFAFFTMRNVNQRSRVRTFLEGVADHAAILAALKSRSHKKLKEAHERLHRGAIRFQDATLSHHGPEATVKRSQARDRRQGARY
jgi:DNA-binding GntR family transcriptional regulator